MIRRNLGLWAALAVNLYAAMDKDSVLNWIASGVLAAVLIYTEQTRPKTPQTKTPRKELS